MNELQEAFNSGHLDEDTFNQQSYALGQQAGQIRDMAYDAELAGYQIKEQREANHAELTKILGDDVWGTPEARGERSRRCRTSSTKWALTQKSCTRSRTPHSSGRSSRRPRTTS